MKKVWVLEGYVSPEECKAELAKLEAMREVNADKPELLETADEMIAAYRRRMEKNPHGYWVGYQGKSVYRDFCFCAKETLRNLKDRKAFRVVEAEIADNAKYWVGYRVVKENMGVLRYLMATL